MNKMSNPGSWSPFCFYLRVTLGVILVVFQWGCTLDVSVSNRNSQNGGGPTQGQFTFSGFDHGTFLGTQLNPDTARLENKAGVTAQLPGNSESNGWLDMTANRLLLHLNEETGTLVDHSGMGHNGAVVGTIRYQESGIFGRSVFFDASNDYIDMGSPASLDDLTQKTVVIWFKVENMPSSNGQNLVQKQNGGLAGWHIAVCDNHPGMYCNVSNSLVFHQGFDTNSGTWLLPADSISRRSWHFLAISYDASSDANKPLMYLDGVVVTPNERNTPSGTVLTDSAQNLTLGDRPIFGGEGLSGFIDEVAIWNRVLSETEIQTIYDRQSQSFEKQIWELPDSSDPAPWFDMTGNEFLLHLDETSGDAVDSSPNSLVGTQAGGINQDMPGHLDRSAHFDGTDNEYDFGNNLGLQGSPMTVSAWVYPRSFGDDFAGIISKFSSSGNYLLSTRNTGSVAFSIKGSGTTRTFQGPPIGIGQWSHLLVTQDNVTTGKIYINGHLAAEKTDYDITREDSGTSLRIGRNLNSGAYFDGFIDEVAIWSRLLSENEIRRLYERQAGHYSGYFQSEVFDAGRSVHWQTLSWSPQRPVLKELPDGGQSEEGFPEGNVDMSDLVGLWHFNGTEGGIPDDSTVPDTSGHSLNGSSFSGVGGDLIYELGVFNQSIKFNASDGAVDLGTDSSLVMNFPRSVSLWFRLSNLPSSTGQEVSFIGKGDQNAAAYEWKVWVSVSNNINVSTYPTGLLASQETHNIPSGVTQSDLHRWVHFAFTVDGMGNIAIFKNGVRRRTAVMTNTTTNTGSKTAIGGFAQNTSFYQSVNGSMDEVVIWNRQLSDSEVKDVYLRGALKARFQVRSCTEANCSNVDFIGPDGTEFSYYSTLTNPVNGLPSLSFSNLGENPYFQYRIYLESSDTNHVSEIRDVEIKASSE